MGWFDPEPVGIQIYASEVATMMEIVAGLNPDKYASEKTKHAIAKARATIDRFHGRRTTIRMIAG